MTVTAVDATGLSPSQITALAKAGVKFAGRYLSHSAWKGLTLGEVANLKAVGIDIFSIYETDPTQSNYFVSGKGKSDALDAISLAKAVGQPENTAIYFTVDYDAKAADLPSILAYFNEIRANLNGFKIGAYGSFTVLNYLHENNAADYWFQTVAWSNGQRCKFLNIYQFQCDKVLAGVNVDFDNFETADIGAWGQVQKQPAAPTQPTPPAQAESVKPAAPTTPTTEWKIFQLTNPQYGLYAVPLTTWKCDSHPYQGWYFVSKEIMTDSKGNVWHHLFIGDNDYGWASQPLLQEVTYTWAEVNIDTTGYLHENLDTSVGTIAKGSKIAVITTQPDKYLVVSNNQPQWVPKNIVTQ